MTDAAHNTPDGVSRLIRWAREKRWRLLPSTRDAAERFGVSTAGVEFSSPGERQ